MVGESREMQSEGEQELSLKEIPESLRAVSVYEELRGGWLDGNPIPEKTRMQDKRSKAGKAYMNKSASGVVKQEKKALDFNYKPETIAN